MSAAGIRPGPAGRLSWLGRWLVLAAGAFVWQGWADRRRSAFFPPPSAIAFGTVWPILVNTIDGARTVDPLQVETARVFRLSAGQRITRLIVPAALPKFFAGLRISVSLSLVLMVVAELTGSTNGIGHLMDQASNSYDMLGLWSGIVLLGILGYLLNAAVLGVEHYLLAWHRGAHRA